MRFRGECVKGTASQDSLTINFTSERERDFEETVQRNIWGKVHWPDAAKIYFLWRQNDTMQRLKQNRKDQQKRPYWRLFGCQIAMKGICRHFFIMNEWKYIFNILSIIPLQLVFI